MKQILAFKKTEVVLEKPQTLRSILEEKMLEQNLDLSLLEKIANHLIFNVEGSMVRDIMTKVKTGATVKLIPAQKAG